MFRVSEPAWRRSSSQALRDAITVLTQPSTGLRLIGLGLGKAAERVRSCYPEHEANVPLDELARQIGALLKPIRVG